MEAPRTISCTHWGVFHDKHLDLGPPLVYWALRHVWNRRAIPSGPSPGDADRLWPVGHHTGSRRGFDLNHCITAMITFFSSAKPFRDRTAIQQRNAINSWLRLGPEVEVMLFGTDEGVAEICAEYNLVPVPDVACTGFGTPLLSDMYAKAQKYSKFPLLCYINADIILLEDFAVAAEMSAKRQA